MRRPLFRSWPALAGSTWVAAMTCLPLMGATRTTSYTYDASHRLSTVLYGQQAAILHQYDASGNRTARQFVGPANPRADFNQDGMPDLWELIYFGGLAVDPGADPDEDGRTNLEEGQNLTDPLTPELALEITGFALTPQGFSLTWTAASNARYRVWWSDDVARWDPAHSTIVQGGAFLDPPGPAWRFYRVSVE